MKGTQHQKTRTFRRRDTAWRWDSRKAQPEHAPVVAGHRHYSPELGRWVNRDPNQEPGHLLLSLVAHYPLNHGDLAARLAESEELGGLYLFCINNPMYYIDPDGQAVIVVAVTTYTVGTAVSNAILAAWYCARARQCLDRAHGYMLRARSMFESRHAAVQFARWLRATKPGSECGSLSAKCGKHLTLTVKFTICSVMIKYGLKLNSGVKLR